MINIDIKRNISMINNVQNAIISIGGLGDLDHRPMSCVWLFFLRGTSVPRGTDLFFFLCEGSRSWFGCYMFCFRTAHSLTLFAWSQQLYELDTEKYWQILHLQRNKSEVFVADLALTPLRFYAFLSTIHLFHIHCCQAVTMTL